MWQFARRRPRFLPPCILLTASQYLSADCAPSPPRVRYFVSRESKKKACPTHKSSLALTAGEPLSPTILLLQTSAPPPKPSQLMSTRKRIPPKGFVSATTRASAPKRLRGHVPRLSLQLAFTSCWPTT